MTVLKINGEARPLKLTLGALAEIETALGGDVAAIAARLSAPRVADILLILRALIEGGGAAMTLEALKAADIDVPSAAAAIADAFGALEAPGKPAGESASPSATGSRTASSS